MPLQTIIAVLQWAWCYTPFPWVLAVLTLAAMAWLWLEYQATRLGRKVPRYHRPIPILPSISLAAVFSIRFSWLMVKLWAMLFVIMLAMGVAASQEWLPQNTAQEVVSVGGYWRLGTIWLVEKLPDAIGNRLVPSKSCRPSWQDIHAKEADTREGRPRNNVTGSPPAPMWARRSMLPFQVDNSHEIVSRYDLIDDRLHFYHD